MRQLEDTTVIYIALNNNNNNKVNSLTSQKTFGVCFDRQLPNYVA